MSMVWVVCTSCSGLVWSGFAPFARACLYGNVGIAILTVLTLIAWMERLEVHVQFQRKGAGN